MSTIKSHAWLLPLRSDFVVAVSDVEMVEYLIDQKTIPVPLTPYYCRHVIVWREALLPVFDLNPLFTQPALKRFHHFGVLAYQTAPKTPLQYLIVALSGSPARVAVDDEKVADTPEEFSGPLRNLALATFLHNDQPVPILNISHLASGEFLRVVPDLTV